MRWSTLIALTFLLVACGAEDAGVGTSAGTDTVQTADGTSSADTTGTPGDATTAPGDATAKPDDDTTGPEADVTEPEADVTEPEADVTEPDDDTTGPEADVTEPEADVIEPEADVIEPEADVIEPEADVTEPEEDVTEPEEDTPVEPLECVPADCDDGIPCTADECQAGVCLNEPITGCCAEDTDCVSDDSCIVVGCAVADGADSGVCEAVGVAEDCCESDAGCDDQNPCTADTCAGSVDAPGACVYTPEEGCCAVDTDCADFDANPCVVAVCAVEAGAETGACEASGIAEGCCETDAGCDDQDPCTTDTCGGTVGDPGTCDNAAAEGCCTADTDCDNGGDDCILVACIMEDAAATGSCDSVGLATGCCYGDSDCDDDDACTTDVCVGGDVDVTGACNPPMPMADGESCGEDLICVTGVCEAAPVCGDGVQGYEEACDDGGTKPGDGCSMTCTIEDFQVGDIIFTEFMPNPTQVLDADGEWIEVYNTTAEDIDINGWTLTDTNDNPHVITSDVPVWVMAGGFLALTLTCDAATNGGIEPGYCYAGVIIESGLNPHIILNNDTDDVELGWNGIVMDTLSYDVEADWFIGAGVATQLSDGSLDGVSNNASTAWCAASSMYGDGDMGTPGTENVNCP